MSNESRRARGQFPPGAHGPLDAVPAVGQRGIGPRTHHERPRDVLDPRTVDRHAVEHELRAAGSAVGDRDEQGVAAVERVGAAGERLDARCRDPRHAGAEESTSPG
jgi:hypothetical protein